MSNRKITSAALVALQIITSSGFCAITSLAPYSIDLAAPTIDKWVYPFAAAGGGARTTAPVFGAIGNIGTFDDRDGQFFVGYTTSGAVPSGQGAANYIITSATLTLRLSFGVADMVIYDGSYDLRSTYDPATGAPINGDDPGRPVELYGAAYRNGFTASSIAENTPFSPPGDPTAEGVRNIHPSDFAGSARDISNNIRDAFDPTPFAVGQVAASDLNPDGTMKGDIDVVFTLDLLNPNVVGYLQRSLDEGRVNLLVNSLHQASQGGPATRPEFDAKELGAAGVPGRLEMELVVVPEPSGACLLAVGVSTLAGCGRRRSAHERRGSLIKSRSRSQSARAFTLMELLVVIAIIAIVAAIAGPVVSSMRKKSDSASEISSARQLMMAYASYASEHDGRLMPGYGNFPAKDDRGNKLHSPVSNRYPWRLAPYFSYDLRILYGRVGDSRLKLDRARDYDSFVYAVSVAPSLGMNTVLVGGDYQMLNPENPRALNAYGPFCATRMAHAIKPERLIVFASACFESEGERIPGYFRIEPPSFVTGRRWAPEYSLHAPPDAYGHVDFRYGDRAVVAMLDGHVELLDFEQMNDMRRWSNVSADANQSSGWITIGNPVDGDPPDDDPESR